MHDAWSSRRADTGDFRVDGQQTVDQCPGTVPGTRVDDQAGRFIHHQDIIVGVQDHYRYRGIRCWSTHVIPLESGHCQLLALPDTVGAEGDYLPVQGDPFCLQRGASTASTDVT